MTRPRTFRDYLAAFRDLVIEALIAADVSHDSRQASYAFAMTPYAASFAWTATLKGRTVDHDTAAACLVLAAFRETARGVRTVGAPTVGAK